MLKNRWITKIRSSNKNKDATNLERDKKAERIHRVAIVIKSNSATKSDVTTKQKQ
jgi:hypothetical protein